MDKFEFKGFARFVLYLLLLSIFYFGVLPQMAKMVPKDYRENLDAQNIDATPLFYSESEQALNSYYFLELSQRP
ncbi:MAG: hypothetical protein KDC80_13710 [Saprospiraceae bacterium]|nr:hypothetical protein [Saprospiraceae bacterium]